MVTSKKMWFGEVDRISGSGNAMIYGESIRRLNEAESRLDTEVNLGPLPQEIVGEEVLFAYERGTYGLCLDPRYVDEDYIRGMNGWLKQNSIEIETSDLPFDVDILDNINVGDILLADNFFSNPERELRIDTQDSRHFAKIGPKTGGEWNCLGIVEDSIGQNEVPIPVKVTEVHPTYVEAKGALPETGEELPNIGKTVTVTTGPQTEIGTLAIYETDYVVPILLEDTQYPSGETLKLRINGNGGTHLIGEAVFSQDNFDNIYISSNKLPQKDRQSRNRIITQGVPIDIEPVPEGAPTTNRITVTDKNTDALVGRWDIQEEIDSVDIAKGDEVQLDIQSVDESWCVGYYKQFPVCVNFHTAVPTEFERESLSVSIQSVHPDKAIAEPKWITDVQGAFEVRIVGTASDTMAIREGNPIQIPNSSVVSSGDHVLIGLRESSGNDVATGTVSARPVFQDTNGPHLVRLPQLRGDVVNVGGTPTVVDHLPDVDTVVTLGVAEVNGDHIVPTVTALPEAHLPEEGAYISAERGKTVGNMLVCEELPLKLPFFLAKRDGTIVTRVLERRSKWLLAVAGSVGDDTNSRIGKVYESIQLAGFALQQRKYRDAGKHLNEGLQSVPSGFPVFKRLLTVHKEMIQTIVAIRDNAELAKRADILSRETSRIREFELEEWSTGDVGAFLSAREAEMRAAERLLIALDEVDQDSTSNLQAIAQGVSAKAPAVKAAEHLRTAEELVAETPFNENIPSLEVRAVIQEFEERFPGIVDELRPFEFPEDDADWFQHFRPEWMIEQTDATLPNIERDGETWQRPPVPETMGIVSIMNNADDVDAQRKHPTATQNISEIKKGPQSKESDGPNIDTTESRQTDVKGQKNSATDQESPAFETGQKSVVTEEGASEQVPTTEANSDESEAETTTNGQTSANGNTSENKTQDTSAVETASSTAESEKTQSEKPDEPLLVPDDSPKLRELRKKAEAEASENPEREHVETTATRYRRSPAVREYALKRADGNCEVCGEVAPFVKENGEPFLEVHHVEELSEGGADRPSLVGAVCPNCHREIHHGKRGDDLNKQLRSRLEKGLGDVGTIDE